VLTDDERAALKAEYPAHWFVRVVKSGMTALVAIPKTAKGEVQLPNGGPMYPVEMLHGMTILIGENA